MQTTITAQMLRDARMQGNRAVEKLLAQIPSVETANSDEIDRFIEAMERPHA